MIWSNKNNFYMENFCVFKILIQHKFCENILISHQLQPSRRINFTVLTLQIILDVKFNSNQFNKIFKMIQCFEVPHFSNNYIN